MGVDELNEFSFPTTFTVEVDPEFPGTGEWGCREFGFGRDGHIEEAFLSPWGSPMVVRIEPADASEWVGTFAAGGLGGLRAVVGGPSPSTVAVVVDGLGYVVDVDHPEDGALIASDQVHQVVALSEPPLLLFVRPIAIDALGPGGMAWSSPRLCVDDLAVITASSESIVCTCDNLGGSETIEVDPTSGEQTGGTTMRDLGWPTK